MTTIEPTFEIVPADAQLAPAQRHSLEEHLSGFFKQADKWSKEIAGITSPKVARAARLEIKALRVAAEKKRKELKEESLRYGKAVDGANNILLAIIVPLEEKCEAIEKAEERRLAAEIQERHDYRSVLIAPYGVESITHLNLGAMSEEDFNAILADAKAMHEARVERERKAEEERVARDVAERKERERIRLENERLLREAAEREEASRVERETADAERRALESRLAAERAEADRKAKEAEAKARAEREVIERKAAAERAAREKLESEAKAVREAEAKKLRDEAEAAERAAQAPDKEKLHAYADAILNLIFPKVQSEKAKTALTGIASEIQQVVANILNAAAKL